MVAPDDNKRWARTPSLTPHQQAEAKRKFEAITDGRQWRGFSSRKEVAAHQEQSAGAAAPDAAGSQVLASPLDGRSLSRGARSQNVPETGAHVRGILEYDAPLEGYLNVSIGALFKITHPEWGGYSGGTNLDTQESGWFPVTVVQQAMEEAMEEGEIPAPAGDGPVVQAQGEATTGQAQSLYWKKYTEPFSMREWWCKLGEQLDDVLDFFYVDTPGVWQRYLLASGSTIGWWRNNETEQFFIEP